MLNFELSASGRFASDVSNNFAQMPLRLYNHIKSLRGI